MPTDSALHEMAYSEWREHAADEYVQAQRRAFLDGFETAAQEAEEFRLLREWLESQRDKAEEQREQATERGDDNREHMHFCRGMAFTDVLVKLSQIGCRSESVENDT